MANRPATEAAKLYKDKARGRCISLRELKKIAEAASDLTWAVQVGVFGQPERAASVVSRLGSLNYPAFERDVEFGDKGRFRVAFAGPYGSREAAAAALEALRRLPGFESAVARPLAR